METLRFLDLPFSIRKSVFMRLESISYKSVLIFLIFNIPISLRAQIFNWGGGNLEVKVFNTFLLKMIFPISKKIRIIDLNSNIKFCTYKSNDPYSYSEK